MPLLADPLRILLLRLLVNDLCERGEIRYYATLRDKPGFIAALRNTIEELKRARILPRISLPPHAALIPAWKKSP